MVVSDTWLFNEYRVWCFQIDTESGSSLIGHINLVMKCAGARSAVNPHAACDEAGTGNGITVNPTRARRRKLRIQTRVHLVDYRASPRPYVRPAKAGVFSGS